MLCCVARSGIVGQLGSRIPDFATLSSVAMPICEIRKEEGVCLHIERAWKALRLRTWHPLC